MTMHGIDGTPLRRPPPTVHRSRRSVTRRSSHPFDPPHEHSLLVSATRSDSFRQRPAPSWRRFRPGLIHLSPLWGERADPPQSGPPCRIQPSRAAGAGGGRAGGGNAREGAGGHAPGRAAGLRGHVAGAAAGGGGRARPFPRRFLRERGVERARVLVARVLPRPRAGDRDHGGASVPLMLVAWACGISPLAEPRQYEPPPPAHSPKSSLRRWVSARWKGWCTRWCRRTGGYPPRIRSGRSSTCPYGSRPRQEKEIIHNKI